MTKQEVVKKLREIADELETTKSGSAAGWTDFELEKLIIIGRPNKSSPFAPVLAYNVDLGMLTVEAPYPHPLNQLI
jgi:hypothetical protein